MRDDARGICGEGSIDLPDLASREVFVGGLYRVFQEGKWTAVLIAGVFDPASKLAVARGFSIHWTAIGRRLRGNSSA